MGEDYTIPLNLEFKFNEYCFSNKWLLTWKNQDGKLKWVGNNIQGHTHLRTSCQCKNVAESDKKVKGCFLLMRNDNFHKVVLNNAENLMEKFYNDSIKKFYFVDHKLERHPVAQ